MAPLLLFYFEALIIGLAYPMGFEPGTGAEAVRCAIQDEPPTSPHDSQYQRIDAKTVFCPF